ncbi:MAG: Mpo1-like protein [Pyrinomonadaceae bacterium]
MTERRYKSFTEFWPFYVAEHSRRGTRLLHLIGTTTGLALLIFFIASGRWWLFPLAFIPGYGAAWAGHFFIEKNRPATFQYPLWSFISDYKMIGLMLVGRMELEVKRVERRGALSE